MTETTHDATWSISDLAGRSSHLDFKAFLPVAARYASQVAHRLAPVI
mgnify:CR=1 FL=1